MSAPPACTTGSINQDERAAWLDVRWYMPARMAVYKIWAVPHLAWEETRGRRRGPAGGMDGCIMHHVTHSEAMAQRKRVACGRAVALG